LHHTQKQNESRSGTGKVKIRHYKPNPNNGLQVGTGSTLPIFQISKTSTKKFGTVKSFAANTHVGLVRKSNEDRIAIILNVI
jgi:hypothetical protein